MPNNDLVLEVKDLKTYFYLEQGVVRAVDGVSFEIRRGRTLGVLGESGCGKSVTAQSILNIVMPPGRIVGGEVVLHRRLRATGSGTTDELVELTKLAPHGREIRSIRGCEIAMVFQEPMTFLNPIYTVGEQIIEAIVLHQQVPKPVARQRAVAMLDRVGMPEPERTVDSYPHQLSGGMRQRVMIAMALACSPSLLIADEPTTALDVTTEAQILELMKELQADLGMAIMYITHNLGVIAEMADEVIVMYLGTIVEHAKVVELFHHPQHPYTQALLRSVPRLGRKSNARLDAIRGMVPDPSALPVGCAFHPRCDHAVEGLCNRETPELIDLGGGHMVRCFRAAGGNHGADGGAQ